MLVNTDLHIKLSSWVEGKDKECNTMNSGTSITHLLSFQGLTDQVLAEQQLVSSCLIALKAFSLL